MDTSYELKKAIQGNGSDLVGGYHNLPEEDETHRVQRANSKNKKS